jgi:hypothetical protein
MAEHKHEATCPVCGGTLTDVTEVALIEKVQRHAKENHGKELTKEQARGLFKDQVEK